MQASNSLPMVQDQRSETLRIKADLSASAAEAKASEAEALKNGAYIQSLEAAVEEL